MTAADATLLLLAGMAALAAATLAACLSPLVQRRAQARVDRMVADAVAATDPTVVIAADAWADELAAADEWRRIQNAVAAAHFDTTLGDIRRLPETGGAR